MILRIIRFRNWEKVVPAMSAATKQTFFYFRCKAEDISSLYFYIFMPLFLETYNTLLFSWSDYCF